MPARAKPMRPPAAAPKLAAGTLAADVRAVAAPAKLAAGTRTGIPSAKLAAKAPAGPAPAKLAAGARPTAAAKLITAGPRAEWRVGELTLVVTAARVELRYAREPIGSCPPTREAIADAVERARGRLAARSRGPDELLPALVAAYAQVLARRGDRPGARVPLVELRDAIDGYTRAQFAWDLARLRRERRLAIAGHRLDLGVATGHDAGRRSRAVWIESDGGGGGYFATFRLIPEEAP
jgi:hypothetical protein